MKTRSRRRTGSLGSLAVAPMAGLLRTMLFASLLAIALVQARQYVEAHGTILPAGPAEPAEILPPQNEADPVVVRVQRPRFRRVFRERTVTAVNSSGDGGELSR